MASTPPPFDASPQDAEWRRWVEDNLIQQGDSLSGTIKASRAAAQQITTTGNQVAGQERLVVIHDEVLQPVVKPHMPTKPVLTTELGTVTIAWDGDFVEDAPHPSGFAGIIVQMSDDEPSTNTVWKTVGQPLSEPGQSAVYLGVVGDRQWFRFLAVNNSKMLSEPSEVASIVVVGVQAPDIDGAIMDAINQAAADSAEAVELASVAEALASTAEVEAAAAQAAAGNALNTANTAQGAADSAAAAAAAAAGIAGGKGEVIFSATAPATDKRVPQNLWIDTTGGANTPKRWNGNAWVAVTDKAATDAATAAAAAKTAADNAAADAAAAAIAAGNALTTANGKNKIWHQASQPPLTGNATGDIWWDSDDGNRMYEWSGAAWVANQFGTNALSDTAITAGKLADNAVTSAKIAAKAVTSAELADAVNTSISTAQSTAANAATVAGNAATAASTAQTAATNARAVADKTATVAATLLDSTENKVLDPSMSGGLWIDMTGGWVVDTTTGRTDTFSLRTNTANGATNVTRNPDGSEMRIPVAPGQIWELGGWYKTTTTWNGTANNSKLRLIDQTGAMRASAGIDAVSTAWKWVSARYTIPATGVTSLRLTIVSDNTVGSAWWDDLVFREISDVIAAETAAAQAKSAADAAQGTANTATTLANGAKTAADAAASAASAAQSAATAAQTTANGKNKIVRSGSAATGTNYSNGDQWWQFSGSQVTNMWIYENGWVKQTITDSLITNLNAGTITAGTISTDRFGANTITGVHIAGATVTAANMVAGTITAASGIIADAAISRAKIQNLAVDTAQIADLAVETGKINSLAVTEAKIASLAVTEAKIANLAVTNGKIANLAVNNAKIADATIEHGKIATLDANKITVGTLDAARIKANSIGVNKLLVTSFENLALDSSFEYVDSAAWTTAHANTTIVTGNARTGSYAMRLVTGTAAFEASRQTQPFYVEPGDRYRISGWVRLDSGTSASNGVTLRFLYGATEATATTASADIALTPNGTGTTYVNITGVWTVPAAARFAVPSVVVRDVVSGKVYRLDDVEVYKMASGEMIVDGAITADKIATNAVTADKVAANAIEANAIKAGALDGIVITGPTIRTAASGQRVQLDTAGLRAFNSSNAVTGALTASSGGLTLSGTLRSGAGNQRVEMTSSQLNFFDEAGVARGNLSATNTVGASGVVELQGGLSFLRVGVTNMPWGGSSDVYTPSAEISRLYFGDGSRSVMNGAPIGTGIVLLSGGNTNATVRPPEVNLTGSGRFDFTGLSTVQFDNVFSPEFDNYRIVINIRSMGASASSLFIRMRSGTTSNTTANYHYTRNYGYQNQTLSLSSASQTRFELAGGSGLVHDSDVMLYDPRNPVNMRISATTNTLAGSSPYYSIPNVTGGYFNGAVGFTGFQIVNSGTNLMNGSVTIYGVS